jgi:hypothetical protein
MVNGSLRGLMVVRLTNRERGSSVRSIKLVDVAPTMAAAADQPCRAAEVAM